jgi:hypothetical protein
MATGIDCTNCGGPVAAEFHLPNDIWNAVMRPDGHETSNEYLCLKCWHAKLRERLNLPPATPNPYDYEGTAGAA